MVVERKTDTLTESVQASYVPSVGTVEPEDVVDRYGAVLSQVKRSSASRLLNGVVYLCWDLWNAGPISYVFVVAALWGAFALDLSYVGFIAYLLVWIVVLFLIPTAGFLADAYVKDFRSDALEPVVMNASREELGECLSEYLRMTAYGGTMLSVERVAAGSLTGKKSGSLVFESESPQGKKTKLTVVSNSVLEEALCDVETRCGENEAKELAKSLVSYESFLRPYVEYVGRKREREEKKAYVGAVLERAVVEG